ncbi:MAG: hypothetical protein HGA78_01935 [Nitrospirales bacterium]|nr:hypothetical protein [Nitrospirales bacterium]
MTDQDSQHLKVLSVLHYVVGCLGIVASCLPLLHIAMGVTMLRSPALFARDSGPPPPPFLGWILISIGLFFILFGMAMSIGILLSGRYISRRRGYLYSFVIACIECVFFPFGTALGVFSIVVLSRPSVKELYRSSEAGHFPNAEVLKRE